MTDSLKILFIVILVVFVASCLPNYSTGDKLIIDKENPCSISVDSNWTHTKIFSGEPIEFIEEWTPKEFDGTGKLKNLWERRKMQNPVIASIIDIGAYPKSWGTIDPATGDILRGYSDEYRADGITDGKYVYAPQTGDTSWVHFDTWRLSDGKLIEGWGKLNLPHNRGYELVIVDGCLIQIHNPMQLVLSRLKPSNGNVLWEITTKVGVDSAWYFYENENIVALYVTTNQEADNNIKNNMVYVAIIDPSDGTTHTELLFSRLDNDIIDVGSIDGMLWVLLSGGELFEINTSLLTTVNTHQINIKDGMATFPDYLEHNAQICDKYVLFEYYDEDWEMEQVLYDTEKNDVLKFLNNQLTQIINHTLITTTDNQIQSLDPETLEPIWWIDLEKEDLGDNPRVIWCDWRGVLVMSDTKLACFVSEEKDSK